MDWKVGRTILAPWKHFVSDTSLAAGDHGAGLQVGSKNGVQLDALVKLSWVQLGYIRLKLTC